MCTVFDKLSLAMSLHISLSVLWTVSLLRPLIVPWGHGLHGRILNWELFRFSHTSPMLWPMLKCALLSSYFSFQTISHSSVKQSNTLYLITVIYIYINIIAPLHGFVLACGVKVLARFCTIRSCAIHFAYRQQEVLAHTNPTSNMLSLPKLEASLWSCLYGLEWK